MTRRHAFFRIALLALVCGPLVPASTQAQAPVQDRFGQQQFEEVLSVLQARYIEPELTAAHIWAAAANGAVRALHRKIELLPSGFVAVQKFSEARFSGRTAPLTCQGRTLPGVVVHTIPRRKQGDKAYGSAAPSSTGEPLVDALLAWPPPFTKADFLCTVDWVQAQIVGRSDTLDRNSRVKRLDDATAAARRTELWRTAATFMLRALDPHSRLTTERKWAKVTSAGTYVVKLGVTLRWVADKAGKTGFAQIVAIDDDSEAAHRDVRIDDRIVGVDGKACAGMTQEQFTALLTRPAGSKAVFGLQRRGSLRPIIVELVFLATEEADVEVTPLAGVPGAVRIRIRKFAPGGDERLAAQLERARKKARITGMLLDMRGNGGGIVPVAVGIVEQLVAGGLVVRVKTRDAVAGVKIARRRRHIESAPLVVLVDARCASACEFTAGALQDSLRGLVVGERTYGKATMQEYIALKTAAARVMVTVAMFFSPSGHPIQASGITPDIPIPAAPKTPEKHRHREQDVPFHLTAESLATERDVSFWRQPVAACLGTPTAADQAAVDFRLARGTTALRCLMAAIDGFEAKRR